MPSLAVKCAPRSPTGAAPWLAATLLLVLAVVSFRHGQDFAVFWRTGRRLLAGESIYPPADGFLVYRYAPGTALAFTPFAALPFSVAKAVWYALLVACGALVVHLLAAASGPGPGPGTKTRAAALALLALSRPLLEEFACAQVNLVVLLLLLAAFACEDAGKERRAGLLIALAVGLKLAPALILLDVALRKRWRTLAGFALGAAAIAAAPIARYGLSGTIELHRAWMASLLAASPGATAAPGNQSLFGLAARVGLPPFAAVATAAALAGFVLLRSEPEPRRALLLFATALASPMGWIQNYVMALPALFAVAHAGGRRATAAATLGALLLVPLYDVTGPRFEQRFFSWSLPLAAMGILFALAARSRNPGAESGLAAGPS
jgi:alpha-1,2-mannosyltransferase